MNTEQERVDFEAFLRSIDGASVKHTREGDYYEDWADTRAWRAWQARAALQSQDREDAARFRFCLEHGFPQKWEEMVRGNLRIFWTSKPGSQEEFSSAVEAIDAARKEQE